VKAGLRAARYKRVFGVGKKGLTKDPTRFIPSDALMFLATQEPTTDDEIHERSKFPSSDTPESAQKAKTEGSQGFKSSGWTTINKPRLKSKKPSDIDNSEYQDPKVRTHHPWKLHRAKLMLTRVT
jgi:hypothetical protein